MKENLSFEMYSVLKNEDANPFIKDNLLVIADGLGGSGGYIHNIDKNKHNNIEEDLYKSAFNDFEIEDLDIKDYLSKLIEPMIDGKDDTSALWGSRIVIARFVYAVINKFKDKDFSNEEIRKEISNFLIEGLNKTAEFFDLKKGALSGQLILPTTLAAIRFKEDGKKIKVEALWAGDSRCYCLTKAGLKQLSKDDEDLSGAITNLYYAQSIKESILNYRCLELDTPCILLTVSDGMFDPFSPYDNLGLEKTLLEHIQKANNIEELKVGILNTYNQIRQDDSTMVFYPIGFENYEQIKKALKPRTNQILEFVKKIEEKKELIALNSISLEDINCYLEQRTKDKYTYIKDILIDNIESTDIIISDFINTEVDNIKKELDEVENDSALNKMKEEISKDPNVISQEMKKYLENKDDKAISKSWKNIQSTYQHYKNKEKESNELENRLNALQEQLKENEKKYKDITGKLDEVLYHDDGNKLEEKFFVLKKIFDNNCKDSLGLKKEIKSIESQKKSLNLQKLERKYKKKVEELIVNLKDNSKNRRDIFEKYLGLTPLEKEEKFKEKINNFLDFSKGKVIEDIIKSLAENYNSTSNIDVIYASSKLNNFRMCHSLEKNPDRELEEIKNTLLILEKEYTNI